ncbi:hypothetical protein CERSUDRAFT_47053 [Gelatoporia subvermispora B]|uniref:Glucose-methanol-choline oxidoreductase N-terminal domain-containing protein n=1 Tax=Ceriporiopsis subvermispora (strain B) TaxID=914234 RepID=M2RKP8_CERS8|nr:hypothetical protein CERSUDRAFT_47053 [Gelatoporia subvermispora B]
MRSVGSLLAAVSICTFAACYPAGSGRSPDGPLRDLRRQNIVHTDQVAQSYDFVIVGGGTSGLVLASRLSEDSNTTVLVLEAGDTGDAVSSSIDVPGNAYYSSLLGTSYDWAYTTVPQPSAGNRSLPWPRGKVLGGSSAINGMYLVRPSAEEVDAWSSMVDSGSQWSWDSLFSAMKTSETFTPPSPQIQAEGNILYDNSSRGFSGPLHASYPGYMMPAVGNWTQTLSDVGIPATTDAYGGDGWGSFIATSSINPSNWTRSYSRSAYIDPLPPRPNLAIVANATVTRIVFSNTTQGNLTAVAVEYASARGASAATVGVGKEVILASGAIGSPHVLMLSGVGPADVLQAAGVPVQVELPGVGQHLQDHIATQVVWQTSEQTAASIHAANATTLPDGTSSPFLSFINSATAYANITNLLGDGASAFQSQIAGELAQSSMTLVPSQNPEVVAGYEAIYNVTLNQFLMSPVGQVEILLSLTGTALGAQSITIQAALQHPFSQGRIWINSSDPFDYPVIDPQYLSHPADTVMLREGLKLARAIGNTAPLSSAMQTELAPGPSVSSDDDWDAWLATQIQTEYHPSCSCAMLPQSQGGVVDANLKVYGLANVRVADASVFPIQFAAHLQAPTYGLAEQAAQLIRNTYNGASSSSSTSSSSSGSISPTTSPSSDRSNAAVSYGPGSQTFSVASAVLLVLVSQLF